MRDPSNWLYQDPVPFDILVQNGVPEVVGRVEERTAAVDYVCEWGNRYIVTNFLLGTGTFGPGAIVHPKAPDLFARRCTITGFRSLGIDSSSLDFIEFQFAKLNVVYLPLDGLSLGGDSLNLSPLLTVETESTGEYMTIPGRQVKWAAGAFNGQVLDDPPQRYFPKKVHKVTVNQWQLPPWSNFTNAQGCVNDADFNWIGRTIPPGWLLFDNYAESFDIFINGIYSFKIVITLIEKTHNWNRFPEPGTGNPQQIDTTIFPSASFAGIFP